MKPVIIIAIAFVLIGGMLGGVMYMGSNTDKFSIDFDSSDQIHINEIRLNVLLEEVKQELSYAQSSEDIELIIKDKVREIMDNPQVERECIQIIKDDKKEREKMIQWVESGKDRYSFPSERLLELTKLVQFCSVGWHEGWYEPLDPSFFN